MPLNGMAGHPRAFCTFQKQEDSCSSALSDAGQGWLALRKAWPWAHPTDCSICRDRPGDPAHYTNCIQMLRQQYRECLHSTSPVTPTPPPVTTPTLPPHLLVWLGSVLRMRWLLGRPCWLLQPILGLLQGVTSLSPHWPALTRSLCSWTPVWAPRTSLPLLRAACVSWRDGAQPPPQLGRFYKCSELANIFSLSTPQFWKFKPHHMLWPRGLGEVVQVVWGLTVFL